MLIDTNAPRERTARTSGNPPLSRRSYSPYGRFVQPDPIGYDDGMDMYAYVRDDPVNNIDPEGLECTTVTGSRICLEFMSVDSAQIAAERFGLSWSCVQSCNNPTSGGWGTGEFADHIMVYANPRYELVRTGSGPSFVGGFNVSGGIGREGREGVGGGEGDRSGGSDEAPAEARVKRCLIAVGKEGLKGFLDPFSALAGYGKGVYEAAIVSPEDYGKPENRGTFPRSAGSSMRIALRRFIPGYLQAGAVFGLVYAVGEATTNPDCKPRGK